MRRLLLFACGGLLALTAAGPAQYYPGGYQGYHAAYPDAAEALVHNWYARFLHRNAVAGEESGWENLLRQGQQPEMVLASILGSDEYFMNAGGTPDRYIAALYTDLTGNQPNPKEMAFWSQRLSYGYADNNVRTDIAYAMLHRYPQNWTAPPPTGYYPDDHRYQYQKPVYPPYKRY
jgi:hypothetical protein